MIRMPALKLLVRLSTTVVLIPMTTALQTMKIAAPTPRAYVSSMAVRTLTMTVYPTMLTNALRWLGLPLTMAVRISCQKIKPSLIMLCKM